MPSAASIMTAGIGKDAAMVEDDPEDAIDREALRALEAVLGEERMAGFVGEYIVAAGTLHDDLRRAWAVRDWDAAYRPAHNLVSNAGNFGAHRVAAVADRAQKALRLHDAQAVEEALAPLEDAMATASAELRRLYPQA
jgi:HPt (histidine-containing phosphotransfer) domain-containing protein